MQGEESAGGEASIECRTCGAANPRTARFCNGCGAPLASASLRPVICTSCGGVNSADTRFCNRCGAALGPGSNVPTPLSVPGVPLPPATSGLPVSYNPEYEILPPEEADHYEEGDKARDRTVSGLSLLIVAFALGWIPYVSILGGLIALIGLILLFLGRWGFDDRHHAFVLGGIVFLFLMIVAEFFIAIGFVEAVVGDAQTTSSLSGLTSTVQSQIDAFLIATAVVGILAGLAHVLIPYGLADRQTQALLWAAFAFQVAISVVVLALLLPMVNSAVSQALSGTTFDQGPLNDLDATSAVYGTLNVVPSVVFAWAYYRARGAAMRRA